MRIRRGRRRKQLQNRSSCGHQVLDLGDGNEVFQEDIRMTRPSWGRGLSSRDGRVDRAQPGPIKDMVRIMATCRISVWMRMRGRDC
jgi:hypothetical protein